MHHYLKILPQYFEPVSTGVKTFEIRKNDRGFNAGDTVTLDEWDDQEQRYTGNSIDVVITYVSNFEQQPGWVVFGFTHKV